MKDEISLAEGQLSQAFYHIKAADADQQGSPNAALIYAIRPQSSKIQIDKDGYLSLISTLDYEVEKQIEINIEVFDMSSTPLTTTKKMIINVINVNDNPPQLDSNGICEFEVYENAQIG